VAFDAGFEDPNYFTRAFKKTEGLTPKQYQQKVHQSAL
jgi:AraC-like DNA-binding protein